MFLLNKIKPQGFSFDKRNFSLGWILDYRTLANNDDQNYLINGTSTFYDQDDELKKEASFSSNFILPMTKIIGFSILNIIKLDF